MCKEEIAFLESDSDSFLDICHQFGFEIWLAPQEGPSTVRILNSKIEYKEQGKFGKQEN